MRYVLVASPNETAREVMRGCLTPEYKVDVALDKASCQEMFRKRRYEFVFVDLEFLAVPTSENGHYDYRKGLQPFWHVYPTAEIIVLSPHEMIREAVKAVKAGASNYLTYPINPHEVKYVTESIYEFIKIESELDYLRDRFWRSESLEVVRTVSPRMKRVFDKVRSVAPTRATVLLTGETGTGKGEIAKLIHRHSSRSDKQFISVHCGAVPETLIESELFGHEKGAFTGAVRRKLGRFEIAEGGTIFLDEIGTITPSAQIKLLQVLQDRTFQRVGGEEALQSDVRVIAASNIDLKNMSDDGLFRKDLYYRLDVFPIEVPPLRDRTEDIPLLVEAFLRRFRKSHGKEIRDVHPDVMKAFVSYPWPGNIRELENLIERASILETSSILTPDGLPSELFTFDVHRASIPRNWGTTLAEIRQRGIEDAERQYLKEVLASNKGRIKETASVAGITTRHLHKLMTKYGIRKEDFK
jgi:DNA-binding NtrC family response regulator